ncbi:MAG TPA: GNAT family N-acetyltransferase, partial [Ktedonobacterales bacterium]
MERVSIAEVTRANWRATLALGVAPEQQQFIADYAPIAALGLAKAYIRPIGLIWTPYAFYAHDEAAVAEGALVGFTMLAYTPKSVDDYWLFHFFIDQRFQGRGYGALAL